MNHQIAGGEPQKNRPGLISGSCFAKGFHAIFTENVRERMTTPISMPVIGSRQRGGEESRNDQAGDTSDPDKNDDHHGREARQRGG